MIAHLSGRVAEITNSALIVDVGGVGYEVFVASYDQQAAKMGEPLKLYTHYHIRENAHELFGFSSLVAKRLFELLISVSGVGPKMALAILSLGDVEAIRSAIALGDSAFIQRASGVGKRIAERIVLDLKDKVGLPGAQAAAGLQTAQQPAAGDDALDALLALGYNFAQASQALTKIDGMLPVEKRVREALKRL